MKIFEPNDAHINIDSLSLYFHKGDLVHDGQIKFEASYIIFGSIKGAGTITANYNLIVFSDIKCKQLEVKQKLICFGKVECDNLFVGGDFYCAGSTDNDILKVAGKTVAGELINSKSGVFGNATFIYDTALLDGDIKSENCLVVLNEIFGQGKIASNGVVISRECDVELNSNNIFSLSTKSQNALTVEQEITAVDFMKNIHDLKFLEKYDEHSKKNVLVLIKGLKMFFEEADKNNQDFDEILSILANLSKQITYYKKYHHLFQEILYFSELSIVDTVEDFVRLMQLKKKAPHEMLAHSLARDVVGSNFDKQKKNIPNLTLEQKSEQKIIHMLNTVVDCKGYLTNSEYKILSIKLISSLKMVSIKGGLRND